jgi:DNA adenine methylase
MISAKDAITPFLRWAGSKRKLLPRLTPYWGGGYARYIEPFMGSAALFYAAMPSAAVLSDINQELVSTFVAVRDHPRAVYNRLLKIPKGKRSYKKLRGTNLEVLNACDRAARFIFLNRYCFNGIYRTNSKGIFNVPYAASRTGRIPDWEHFSAAAERLQSAAIICADFVSVLHAHVRDGDFVYLDPPYAVENRRIFRQYDPKTFGIEDLSRLSKTLELIDQRGAKFVLSYAASPEAKQYFSDWKRTKVFTQRNVSGFAKHRRMAAELIVTNI